MIYDSAAALYKLLRKHSYRGIFKKIKDKEGSLSATEAFTADAIFLLGQPTVSELAEYLGISQPNATYKATNLAAKGYITKTVSDDDKRECRLHVSDKFFEYFDTDLRFLKDSLTRLNSSFSEEELCIFEKVLKVFAQSLQSTEV